MLPAFVGGIVFAMTQVGSKEAEANFCSWVPGAGDSCLRGVPPEAIQIIAVLLVVGGISWFIWPPVRIFLKKSGSIEFWRFQTGAKIKRSQMWAIGGMIVGGLLFLGCLAYFLLQNSITQAEIQESLQRYVLPRHLSPEQINSIGEYLKSHEPQKVKFEVLKNSEEASQYRVDIQNALTIGGWQVDDISYSVDVREGLTTFFVQTDESRRQQSSPNNLKVDELFREAMRKAGILLAGSGGSGGPSIENTEFIIKIGPRRMDDADIQLRKRDVEHARKLLRGEVWVGQW